MLQPWRGREREREREREKEEEKKSKCVMMTAWVCTCVAGNTYIGMSNNK